MVGDAAFQEIESMLGSSLRDWILQVCPSRYQSRERITNFSLQRSFLYYLVVLIRSSASPDLHQDVRCLSEFVSCMVGVQKRA